MSSSSIDSLGVVGQGNSRAADDEGRTFDSPSIQPLYQLSQEGSDLRRAKGTSPFETPGFATRHQPAGTVVHQVDRDDNGRAEERRLAPDWLTEVDVVHLAPPDHEIASHS